MEVREERQLNPVADHVSALVAVTRPIVAGVLHSIAQEQLDAIDTDRGALPLMSLGRLRKKGDGDCGIAFEYAVHDAIRSQEPVATERVVDALKQCRIASNENDLEAAKGLRIAVLQGHGSVGSGLEFLRARLDGPA